MPVTGTAAVVGTSFGNGHIIRARVPKDPLMLWMSVEFGPLRQWHCAENILQVNPFIFNKKFKSLAIKKTIEESNAMWRE